MIEINLAPGAAGRHRSAGRAFPLQLPSLPSFAGGSRGALLGGAAALLILLALSSFWRLRSARAELQRRVAEEVTDSTRFASTIALLNSLQARQDTMAQKIGIIREVDRRRYVWPHVLDEISRALPAYTWLTQVSATLPKDTTDTAPGFSLQGNAGSTPALTRFMKELEGSPFIQHVTLVTSEQAEMQGRTIQKFTLEAKYQEPDSSVIETVPVLPPLP